MKTLCSFLIVMLLCVTFLQAQCGIPSNPTATATSSSSITFSWNAVSGASLYQLQYKKTTALTWSVMLVGGTSKTLSSLSCGSSYMYKVRAVCGTNYGAYTTTGYVSTQACCTPPTNLSAITSATEVMLSWSPVSNAIDYQVDYKLPAASTWTVAAAGGLGGPAFAMYNLAFNTTYQFRVKTILSGGQPGCYSAVYTYTTGPCPLTPTNVTVSGISFNNAVVSWTSVSGACSNLSYKAVGTTNWTTLGQCGVGSGVSSPYMLTGLVANTSYQVMISGIDWNTGASCASNVVTFTTFSGGSSCAAPTITHTNMGGLHFCGEITSSTISGANTYTLQKRETVGGVWGAWGTIATSSTAFSMYNVCTYPCEFAEYRVFVTCNGVNSAYSNTAGGTYNCRLAAPNSVTEKASIYPNPTMGILHVELNTEDDFGSEISLVDMTGRKVKVFQIEDKSDKAELDLSELDNGIYTLILNEGSIQKMERVVIAR